MPGTPPPGGPLCDTTTGLKNLFPISLETAPITNIRNFMQRSFNVIRAPRELDRDGDFNRAPELGPGKKDKSHRITSDPVPPRREQSHMWQLG